MDELIFCRITNEHLAALREKEKRERAEQEYNEYLYNMMLKEDEERLERETEYRYTRGLHIIASILRGIGGIFCCGLMGVSLFFYALLI